MSHTVRNATMDDVNAIHRLVTHHAELNRMLFRSHSDLYEHLRDFYVAETVLDNHPVIIGCAALELVWRDLAEIKSLAVDQSFFGKGVGRSLVEAAIQEAWKLGIKRLFALTRETAFFEKMRFVLVSRETLPHKVWTDCVNCPMQASCDEVAMVFDCGG